MSYAARHAARVTDQGKVMFSDESAWRAACARHKGRPVWVTVTRQQHLRTPNANRYYWGVVVEEIAGYIGCSRDETHELLKAKFLPERSIELLEGQTLQAPPSTKNLTSEEFAAYLREVKAWAASFLGLSIPDPGEVEVL